MATADTDNRRKFRQISMRTLFLLVAAIAVWTSYFASRSRIATLDNRLRSMRPIARVLAIDDPARYAAVKLDESWFDENRWDVHLPGGSYQLCMATRAVDDNNFPVKAQKVALSPGQHRLELKEIETVEGWQIAVECDGKAVLHINEPKSWNLGPGSSGGSLINQSEQFAIDRPLILFRRRFYQNANGVDLAPNGPTDGVMIWVEKLSGKQP